MADALRAVAGDAVLVVEARARSTAENAALTAALLREHDARSIWVVTQPFHARRAAYLDGARRPRREGVAHRGQPLQYPRSPSRGALANRARVLSRGSGVALRSASRM